RQVRLAMHGMGLPMGTRTKLIGKLIAQKCEELGASPEQAGACGQIIEEIFIKEKKASSKAKNKNSEDLEEVTQSDGENDTLLFLSPKEVDIIAAAFKEQDYVPTAVITQKDAKKRVAELVKIIGPVEQAVNAV